MAHAALGNRMPKRTSPSVSVSSAFPSALACVRGQMAQSVAGKRPPLHSDQWGHHGEPLRCHRPDRAVTRRGEKADRRTAWALLDHLLVVARSQIHAIPTDRAIGTPSVRATMARGLQCGLPPRNRSASCSYTQMRFDPICETNGIEHRPPPFELRGSENGPASRFPEAVSWRPPVRLRNAPFRSRPTLSMRGRVLAATLQP